MKLFKNKVGRPTNEILKKRRNFYIGIVCFIVFLVLTISLSVYGGLNNSASILDKLKISYTDNLSGKKLSKGTKVKLNVSFLGVFGKKYYKILKNDAEVKINNKTCNKLGTFGVVKFNFTMSSEPVTYEVVVYSDSACTKKVKSYKSKTYKIKETISKIKTNILNDDNNSIDVINKVVTAIKNPSSKATISMSKFPSVFSIGSEAIAKVKLALSSDSFKVESSNPEVLSVIKDGAKNFIIKAIGEGKATITVISNRTGKKSSYSYTVKSNGLPKLTRFGNYADDISLKGTYNNIPVYVQNSCSTSSVSYNNAKTGVTIRKVNPVDAFINDINNLESYVAKAIKVIYIVDKDAFNTANKSNASASGIAHASVYTYIDLKCDSYTSSRVAHEAGHAIDYHHMWRRGSLLSKSFEKLYKEYNSTSDKPLRKYSYTNSREFFADAYASYNLSSNNRTLDWKYPSDIKNEVVNAMSKAQNIGW